MNHLGNRGQAGPLGEDMVSIIVTVSFYIRDSNFTK